MDYWLLLELHALTLAARSYALLMGINACSTFVLKVEHPYIVGKSEKVLDMGEPTFHAEKTDCSSEPKCMF